MDRLRQRHRQVFSGFTKSEVERMEKLLKESGEETTDVAFCKKITRSFNSSKGRAGKPALKWIEVQNWFQNPQVVSPPKEDSVDGSNKSIPDTSPLDKPNESTPTSEDLEKRKREESDCEGVVDSRSHWECVGDNFKFFIDQKMNAGASTSASGHGVFTFCWTDARLENLVESYHMYLTGDNCDPVRDSSTHKRCMTRLKSSTEVKHSNDIGHEIEANDYTISNKLDEFAAIIKSKFEGNFCPEYEELKEILGKEMFKTLKKLVQHERFDDYLPLDQPSRRVAPPTDYVLNIPRRKRKNIYWTDNMLQLLVTSLHSYMNKIESERRHQGTLSGDRRACLTFIKKFMDKIDSKQLSTKLDSIFEDEKNGGQSRSHLRMRLGEKCTIFDQLLKTNYSVYKEAGTSSSRITSSSRSISSVGKRSVSMREQEVLQDLEAKQLTKELSKLNLSNTDLVDAIILLCEDSNKRSYFRALPTDDLKKMLVQRWLIKGE